MSIPDHYSRELPNRCLRIIEELLPAVKLVNVPREKHLGPLTTTFVLAMSTPLIMLPIERIERQSGTGYVDDRALNKKLAEKVKASLGGRPFRSSPFFEEGHWRYARVGFEGQNIAKSFPEELREKLSNEHSLNDAATMPASEWASCLRNALAHGGIAYLDARGYQSDGQTAEIFAFVSATYPSDNKIRPETLKALRISEENYLSFLRRWVDWLNSSGFSELLAA